MVTMRMNLMLRVWSVSGCVTHIKERTAERRQTVPTTVKDCAEYLAIEPARLQMVDQNRLNGFSGCVAIGAGSNGYLLGCMRNFETAAIMAPKRWRIIDQVKRVWISRMLTDSGCCMSTSENSMGACSVASMPHSRLMLVPLRREDSMARRP